MTHPDFMKSLAVLHELNLLTNVAVNKAPVECVTFYNPQIGQMFSFSPSPPYKMPFNKVIVTKILKIPYGQCKRVDKRSKWLKC